MKNSQDHHFSYIYLNLLLIALLCMFVISLCLYSIFIKPYDLKFILGLITILFVIMAFVLIVCSIESDVTVCYRVEDLDKYRRNDDLDYFSFNLYNRQRQCENFLCSLEQLSNFKPFFETEEHYIVNNLFIRKNSYETKLLPENQSVNFFKEKSEILDGWEIFPHGNMKLYRNNRATIVRTYETIAIFEQDVLFCCYIFHNNIWYYWHREKNSRMFLELSWIKVLKQVNNNY